MLKENYKKIAIIDTSVDSQDFSVPGTRIRFKITTTANISFNPSHFILELSANDIYDRLDNDIYVDTKNEKMRVSLNGSTTYSIEKINVTFDNSKKELNIMGFCSQSNHCKLRLNKIIAIE